MADQDNRDERPSATPEWKGEHPAREHAGRRYAPSQQEVNRTRMQGMGMGARDLDVQQDATGSPPERQLHDHINRETNEDEIVRKPVDRAGKRQ